MNSKVDPNGSGVTPERFEFSAPNHVVFLDGYMDAVGRVLTTDSVLCALTARNANEVLRGDRVFDAPVRGRSAIENWSKEFATLVDNFLGMDQRSRLGFYLVEYICWFKEFTRNAQCFKLDCELWGAATIDQAVYLLQMRRRSEPRAPDSAR